MKITGMDELFKDLNSLISEIKTDKENVFDAGISNESVISKTPEDAKKRSNYEDYMKKGVFAENIEIKQQIDNIADKYIDDLLRKHIG